MKTKSPLNKLFSDNSGKGVFIVDSESSGDATIWLYDMIVSDNFFGGGGRMTGSGLM
jgi:hypothetical protein